MKALRREKGYTQNEMADLLKCSRSNYEKIETGKVCPSLPMFISIAEVLQTSLDYLTGEEGTYITNRMEQLLKNRSPEELEYLYQVLFVMVNSRPETLKQN